MALIEDTAAGAAAGGVPGAIIGGAASILGGLFSQSSARSAYRHRYQDTVQDLTAAGLNPALAYGQNPGGGAQTADFGNIATQAASSAQAAAQAAKTRAETNVLKAQSADLMMRARLQNEFIGAGIETRRSTTDKYTAQTGLLNYDIAQRKRTLQSDIDAALAANLQQMLQTPEARARAKYYDQTGPASFYLNNALDVGKTVAQLRGAQGLNKPRITNIYPRYR